MAQAKGREANGTHEGRGSNAAPFVWLGGGAQLAATAW